VPLGLLSPVQPRPTRIPAQPLDFYGVFLTLKNDFGMQTTHDRIDAALAMLPMSEVLWILAQLANRADHAGRDGQVELAQQLVPAPLLPRALQLVSNPPRVVTSPQLVLQLALRALLECDPSGDPPADPEELARILGLLLLAIADHVPHDSSSPETLMLELVRNELFFRVHGQLDRYEEAYELFLHTLPRLAGHPDFLDVDAVLRQAHGVSLEEFWTLTVAAGVIAVGDPRPLTFPLRIDGDPINPQTLASWESAWAIDLPSAQALAREDVASGSGWSFTAFYERPILTSSDGRRFAMRAHYLSDKATPTGMFWAVARAWKQLGRDYEQWARLFGAAVEARGLQLVAEHAGDPARLLDDDQLRTMWGAGSGDKVCDLLVLYPEAWVAFEFVHRSLTKATQTTGAHHDLLRDLELAVLEKADQLDATLARGLATDTLPSPDRIFPVVVTGASLPANPPLSKAVAAALTARQPKVLGVDPRCRRLSLIDLFELRNLLDLARAQGATIPSLLEAWVGSTIPDLSLRNWLTTDGPGLPIDETEPDWLTFVSRRLEPSPGSNAE